MPQRLIRRTLWAAGFLLLACILLPAQAPAAANGEACQGSTVDTQGEEVARKARAFLVRLQAAVGEGDKEKVGSMISYPLTLVRGGHRLRIKTTEQFVTGYDQIFDEHVRRAIAHQSAKCLFANYQGVMIGNGEVWFGEQPNGAMEIITVNPKAGN